MTELKLQSTVYSLSKAGSSLKAEGQVTITASKGIAALSLRFSSSEANSVGYSEYSERNSAIECRYNVTQATFKNEIVQITDSIIADIKSQITTEKM